MEGLFHKGTSEDHLVSPFKGRGVWVTLSKHPVHLKNLSHLTEEVVLMLDGLKKSELVVR